jgi:tetratricopeptide (TPR) repeat protein
MKLNMATRLKSKKVLIAAIVGVWLAAMTGCGGVEQVNTDLVIPDMDHTQYSDSNYSAGWQKLREGNPDAAIEYFQKSSVVQEKLFVGYGYAFMAQNKLSLAQRNFEKALEANPENLQAQFGMATLHETTHEYDQAFLIYSRLRTKYPEHSWVKVRYDYLKSTRTQYFLKQADIYKSQQEFPAYTEALKSAIRYSPEMSDIKKELGDFLFQQEQFEPAAKYYEMILESSPNNQEVMMKLALVYEKLNKFDAAVLIYKRIQEFKPGDLKVINKINELKEKFYDWNLPVKFKNIFFKEEITREELAALIGYYFDKYLEQHTPVIITDISGSFAMEQIIRVCSLNIMSLRPDHSFGRFPKINRAQFAEVLNALIQYLENAGSGHYSIQFSPLDEVIEPADISPLHKLYNIIKFMVNSGIMKLDEEKNFNPTLNISPTHVLEALKKILNSIQDAD